MTNQMRDPSLRRIARGTDHVETRQGGRIMAMSLAQGKYFAIEGTGAVIWDLLADPTTEAALHAKLCEIYDVAAEQCLSDLRAFLKDLDDHGLIVESDP